MKGRVRYGMAWFDDLSAVVPKATAVQQLDNILYLVTYVCMRVCMLACMHNLLCMYFEKLEQLQWLETSPR